MAEKQPPHPEQAPALRVRQVSTRYRKATMIHSNRLIYFSKQDILLKRLRMEISLAIQTQQPTAVMATASFRESPVAMTCPNCRASVVTGANYVTGTLACLAYLGLCVIG